MNVTKHLDLTCVFGLFGSCCVFVLAKGDFKNEANEERATQQEISKFPYSFFHGNLGETDSFLWEIEGKRKFPFPS